MPRQQPGTVRTITRTTAADGTTTTTTDDQPLADPVRRQIRAIGRRP